MTLPAYSYSRFSSLEQGRGSSLRRQQQRTRHHIEANGWLWSEDRQLSDEGRSAFSGANRHSGGALYEFERKATLGHFRNGVVLCVEHLDRLTRQGWEEALDILKSLTSNGVTIATVDGSQLYPAGERIDMGQVMLIIVKAELAHDESKKKSDRLLAAWKAKVEAAQNGDRRAMTRQLPSWIEADALTREMRLIPHRASVLREIFGWYEAGIGLPTIVRRLNQRREPSWAVGKKDRGQGWNSAYIHKLLKNRAVMGEFEPMSRTHSGINESSKGIRIADYYPQAIPTDLFNRVQRVKATRQKMAGRSEPSLHNLFGGLIFCTDCGSPMYFHSRQREGKTTFHKDLAGKPLGYLARISRSYVRCNSNRRGHTCANSARYRYEHLEAGILERVLDAAMDQTSFVVADRAAELEAVVAETERLIDGKRHQLDNLARSLAEGYVKSLAARARELEEEVDRAEADLAVAQAELDRERGRGTPEELASRVLEVRVSLESDDPTERHAARARVRQMLLGMLRIHCDGAGISTAILNEGLMAWRFDRAGQYLDMIDNRQRFDLHKGLTTGALSHNREGVEAVLRRMPPRS